MSCLCYLRYIITSVIYLSCIFLNSKGHGAAAVCQVVNLSVTDEGPREKVKVPWTELYCSQDFVHNFNIYGIVM